MPLPTEPNAPAVETYEPMHRTTEAEIRRLITLALARAGHDNCERGLR